MEVNPYESPSAEPASQARAHSEDVPLHTCLTKAIIAQGDQLQTGINWIAARRGRLKLFQDRLTCGDWTVRYADIREAILASFYSPILRLPGYLLSVRTETNTYHFGLDGWRYWRGELPFAVTRCHTRLRLSWISVVARLILLRYFAYVIWSWAMGK